MNLSITFSKYGKREFEASKLTIDELKKSVRKAVQEKNKTGYVFFEATSDNNTKYLIDGTLYNNGFLLQGVKRLYPHKIEENGKVEVVWRPKLEGPTAREYFTIARRESPPL
ncbi:MAG: hypothetical protein WBJ82_01225 [Tepidanaerobacteraceae bacterium]|nr:hypothetical protein [Tepidanaerobacter sp.]HQA60277.1 hypothetical protein [Tepidanaerobacteraceae bacterium]HQE04877.1 hypothetical protein [Tepidanaerobacteraceae bacterium]